MPLGPKRKSGQKPGTPGMGMTPKGGAKAKPAAKKGGKK